MTLTIWEAFGFRLDEPWVVSLPSSAATTDRLGEFFKARFKLERLAGTFIDMASYQQGYVWVNGHNLCRYGNIDPQQRLFCPTPWLCAGRNDIIMLDLQLHEIEPIPIAGKPTCKD